ncbi:hypothetical protein F5B18DRAFT_630940 [Nemania serpens]|nr:hypothetical protein F5B18DRAFT_630940 [Nemania serpens]
MRGPITSTLALTRAHNRRLGGTSELQRRLDAVVKRVVGEDAVVAPPPLPLRSPIEDKNPAVDFKYDDDDDDDAISDYGDAESGVDREEPRITISRALTTNRKKVSFAPTGLSISSPGSYTGLAALNPYALDGDNLARRLENELDDDNDDGDGKERERGEKRGKVTMRYEEEEEKEEDEGEQKRKRAAELDRACAAVLAEEDAARRVLEGLLCWE